MRNNLKKTKRMENTYYQKTCFFYNKRMQLQSSDIKNFLKKNKIKAKQKIKHMGEKNR